MLLAALDYLKLKIKPWAPCLASSWYPCKIGPSKGSAIDKVSPSLEPMKEKHSGRLRNFTPVDAASCDVTYIFVFDGKFHYIAYNKTAIYSIVFYILETFSLDKILNLSHLTKLKKSSTQTIHWGRHARHDCQQVPTVLTKFKLVTKVKHSIGLAWVVK